MAALAVEPAALDALSDDEQAMQEESTGSDVLEAVDEQLIAQLSGRARAHAGSAREACSHS